MAKRSRLERTPEPCVRGQRVTVREANIRPWEGTVAAVKWSHESGWWIDIFRDGGGYWVIHEEAVS
jgi:hypothetical protein